MNRILPYRKAGISLRFVLLLSLLLMATKSFAQITNPAMPPVADLVSVCPDTGMQLPKIFLCGDGASRQITVSSSNLASVIWEKLDESNCPAVVDDCPITTTSCYNPVSTANSFIATVAGHYKVTINSTSGSPGIFYFNVYQNGLDIPITKTDIYCGKPGEIKVAQLTGYEYSLDGTTYQNSNTFSIATAGAYIVKVRRENATPTDCVFEIPVTIAKKELAVVATVIQSTTSGQQGDVKLIATGVRGQYYYKIEQGTTVINSVGPVTESEYTFPNLNAGTYTWSVKTDDCNWKTGQLTINSIAPFQITPTVKPVTCQPGSIKVVVTGGTAPYQYYFNGNTTPETSNLISGLAAGTYTVKVVDNNGLIDQITVSVPVQLAPDYTIEKTNENCYYPNSWQIKFNVTNKNGNDLKFSIDNGATFSTNPVFQGLSATPAGTIFKTVIEYIYNGIKCTKSEDVTIVQPQYGLSATAGVSELIGCLPSPNEDKAKIRITNPQGGTPPYKYSYDNQATWVDDTFVLKPANGYFFYIKDVTGCISTMPKVVVENIGVPSITVTTDSFNCDGTANTTISSTTGTSTTFSYTYSLDGGTFQPTPNFSNINSGSHTIGINYQPLIVPTFSNLLLEDFGYGADTTSPGMNAGYCFERQVDATKCAAETKIEDKEYSVTTKIVNPYGAWYPVVDHTNPMVDKGRFLVVDIHGDNSHPVIYEKVIYDIIPNQPINVEFYATNLLRIGNTQISPNLRVALVNLSGFTVASFDTGTILKTEKWQSYSKVLDPGSNTTLRFQVQSIEQDGNGNDVAIDDITVYQIPKLCAATKIIPFTVPTGKAFDVSIIGTKNSSCAGLSNGEITIAAQNFNTTTGYQYSKDNGANWQTAMTSPFTISGLGGGTYAIKVRYNSSATGVCVKSFSPITITVPTPFVTTANVTKSATCSRGATITASSSGGTPFYQYELWDEFNTTKVRSVQSSGIFDNVPPAKYTLRVLDANGCGNVTPFAITVSPPPIPIPSTDSSSDLCYDAINQATIKINVVSGTAPFSYSLNGGASQTSDTFPNVGPGIHTVEVIDSNSCKATTQNINIGNELKVAAVLTKALDCTSNPDAVVTVNLEGGARPLRYQVKQGGTTITTTDIAIPNTNSSFTYSVKDSQIGTYSFTIIDANGCFKTNNPITINPKTVPVINSITQTQFISCHGESTAAIQVNLDLTKGVGPFSYGVKDVTSLPQIEYGNQVSGLTAGTYEVTVTDANSCTTKDNKTISEPTEIVVTHHSKDITCGVSGVSKGSVIVDSVTGGLPPYNYFVTGVNGYNNFELNNSGTTSYTFDVVDFGLYQINVVDVNGCSVLIQDVKVASPPSDLTIGVSMATSNCSTGGSAIVAVAGTTTFSSTGPFYFAIYTPGLVYNSSNLAWKLADAAKSTTFTGLLPGVKYTFIVYDDTTKCYHYKTAEAAIPTNSTLEVSSLTYKNISCKGSADGKVSFTIKNNYAITTPVFYQVYNSQSLFPVSGVSGTISINPNSSTTISDLGPLPFGNYFVLIKEEAGATNEGCSIASNTFNITESAIDLSLLPKVIKNINCHENGVISIQAKDGTAPYHFQISAASSATSSPTSSTGLIPPPPPSPDGIWGTLNTFSVNQGGSYTVFVKDAYGCVKSQPVTITKDPEPVIGLSISNVCASEGTFAINITETTAGIAPYYISVNGSVFSSATLPYNLSNQNSGDYSISVKDVNGCSNTQTLKIHIPLGLSSSIIKQRTCATTNDGEIKAIAVGGSGYFEYKIDSGSYGTSPIFSGLSSRPHTIYIKDTTTLCEKSISVTLEVPTAVTGLILSQQPVTCNGRNDGSITVTIATPAVGVNDNPIYKYSIDRINFQESNIFSGLAAGSYTVDVISGRGCIATNTISVTEPAAISVPTPTIVQFGCNSTNNLNNASITVSLVTGGSGIYTQYEFIKNGTRVQFGTNPTYIESDLNGGSYTINVYDDRGCSGSTSATVSPFYILDTINVTPISPISCAANETIGVSVSGIGGTPSNLEYSLSTVSGSSVGTIFPSNSNGIFSGLTVGEYLITVRNTETNCIIQEIYTVNEPNTFDLTIDSVVDVSCFGGSNGSANITLTDKNTPSKAGAFSYVMKDSLGNSIQSSTTTSAGPIPISGLKVDVYSITATLTTTPFCSVTKSFTISQPTSELKIGESHSDITCVVGNNDGKITALPTGGWSNFYEFKWEKAGTIIENWGDVYELTNLTQGIYKVYTRDARGCVVDKQVELKNPTPITFNASSDVALLRCFSDRTATISATSVSGGQGSNYWYSLNTIGASPSVFGLQASNEFKNLGAGTYTLTVTDNWSCTATSSPILINEPNNVVATLSLKTPPTCMVLSQLALQISGGTPPYSFSADNSVFSPFSLTLLNGNTGVNHYFVKDNNGCGSYLSNDVVVESPKGLSVSIDATFAKVNCKGDSTASILATAQGGLGNYLYTLLDEVDNLVRPAQITGVFTGLSAGKYKVKITSSDCVPAESTIIITEPAAKLKPSYSLTNALCAGSNDGTVKINSSGGTVVIKQAISPNLSQFTESDLFENLAAGTYDVIVQDALGCYEKTTQVIAQPDPIIASTIASSIVQEICFDDKKAQFSILLSGGTPPYNVSLDNPTGPFSTGSATQTQFDFTGLTGGSHTVYIKDANNCTLDWIVNLNESVKLNPSTIVNYDCVSNAQHNSVTVNLDSSITNFSLVEFALDGGIYQPTNVFSNLIPGDHFIRVKHNNGCIKDTPVFNIKKVDPLILNLKEGSLNEIIALANGGGGNYKYTFDGEFNDTNPSYIYYKTQDYLVTVQDANGCKTVVTQKFNYIDICTPNYFTPNGDGINDTWAPGCTINYKNLTFSVLDRYGRELGAYHLGESWDGKYQGVELPSGDYWYVLKLNNSKDDREFVGHFTLYR